MQESTLLGGTAVAKKQNDLKLSQKITNIEQTHKEKLRQNITSLGEVINAVLFIVEKVSQK